MSVNGSAIVSPLVSGYQEKQRTGSTSPNILLKGSSGRSTGKISVKRKGVGSIITNSKVVDNI